MAEKTYLATPEESWTVAPPGRVVRLKRANPYNRQHNLPASRVKSLLVGDGVSKLSEMEIRCES